MSRWDTQLDSPVIPDGDRFFDAWNSKIHRSILPEGTVPVSVNKRFTDQRASPRKGTIMPAGNSHWYRSDNSQKFIGSGVYVNPNGLERIILCPNGPSGTFGINAYDIDNDHYFTIAIPAPYFIPRDSAVWFVQSFGSLIMLVIAGSMWTGGPNHLTNGWVWDGNESPAGAVFKPFAWNTITDTQVIPPSAYAWPVSDRIAYAWNYLPPGDIPKFGTSGPVFDHILLSDVYGDETGFFQNMDPTLNDFTINGGSTDRIVTVIPYQFDAAIIFMQRSINMLSNFSVDPTLAEIQILTQYMGTCGVRAAKQIGTEVYFFVERLGLFKLSQILDQQIQILPLPLSDDIQPDIDRINWPYANTIVLETENNYLYVAAPIDGAKVPNCLFVLNLATMKWETLDQFVSIPHFGINNLMPVHIGGVRRLVAVQNGPPALLYLLSEGNVDQTLFDIVNPKFAPIPDYMETRGYGLGKDKDPTAWGTFQRGSVVMDTVNPNVQITGIVEGVNEKKVLRPAITKDPSVYYVHAVPPNSPLFDDEKRQDYSLATHGPDNFDAQDFEQMSLGDVALQNQIIPPVGKPGQNFWTYPPQNSRERFPIRMTDRWLSLGIANTLGQATIVATAVEMIESRRNARSAA